MLCNWLIFNDLKNRKLTIEKVREPLDVFSFYYFLNKTTWLTQFRFKNYKKKPTLISNRFTQSNVNKWKNIMWNKWLHKNSTPCECIFSRRTPGCDHNSESALVSIWVPYLDTSFFFSILPFQSSERLVGVHVWTALFMSSHTFSIRLWCRIWLGRLTTFTRWS